MLMKKSRYANIVSHGNESLIHNSLFGGVVKAKCNNSKSFLSAIGRGELFEFDKSEDFHGILKDMRMIVGEDVNESYLANFYFQQRRNTILQIILFVTRQCNFRCVYCYEDHENKVMGEDVYENILSVIGALIDNKDYKTLYVTFFGGEPLLEYKAVLQLSRPHLSRGKFQIS